MKKQKFCKDREKMFDMYKHLKKERNPKNKNVVSTNLVRIGSLIYYFTIISKYYI